MPCDVIMFNANRRRTSITLKNRRLSCMPVDNCTTEEAASIYKINLRRNYLTSTAGLERYKNLTVLYLSYNRLSQLSDDLCSLTALEELYLTGNCLKELPESIGNLTSLRILHLCHNQLAAIPNSLGHCKALEVLTLGSLFGGNRLKKLPESISSLGALKELDVSRNSLTALPEDLGNLSNLQVLNVSNNCLSTVPAGVGQLKALSQLNLACNRLGCLPAEVGQLSRLTLLDLRNNRLSFLPGELCWLPGSAVLLLANNPFVSEVTHTVSRPPLALGSVHSLQELCGGFLLRMGQPVPADLPEELITFLHSAQPCTACRKPFFKACLNRTQALVDVSGHKAVPSLVSLCLPSSTQGCANSSKLAVALNW